MKLFKYYHLNHYLEERDDRLKTIRKFEEFVTENRDHHYRTYVDSAMKVLKERKLKLVLLMNEYLLRKFKQL